MDLQQYQITLGQVLSNPRAKQLLASQFPQMFNNPALLRRAWNMPLYQVMQQARRFVPQQKIQQVLRQLEAL